VTSGRLLTMIVGGAVVGTVVAVGLVGWILFA
jgi:hypothetical protein